MATHSLPAASGEGACSTRAASVTWQKRQPVQTTRRRHYGRSNPSHRILPGTRAARELASRSPEGRRFLRSRNPRAPPAESGGRRRRSAVLPAPRGAGPETHLAGLPRTLRARGRDHPRYVRAQGLADSSGEGSARRKGVAEHIRIHSCEGLRRPRLQKDGCDGGSVQASRLRRGQLLYVTPGHGEGRRDVRHVGDWAALHPQGW